MKEETLTKHYSFNNVSIFRPGMLIREYNEHSRLQRFFNSSNLGLPVRTLAAALKRDAEAILQIPRAQFAQLEEQTSLEVGFQLVAQMPHGPAPFTVTELSDDTVTADFNHALAGKELTFEVEVIEVSETPSGCGDPNCSSDSC